MCNARDNYYTSDDNAFNHKLWSIITEIIRTIKTLMAAKKKAAKKKSVKKASKKATKKVAKKKASKKKR